MNEGVAALVVTISNMILYKIIQIHSLVFKVYILLD
jgi:hypothetical protein